ncbi:hypothetical protein V6N12_058847 [Hibiscus sabdariffa]|uniref:Uncharacterized protein n=1 Tax=Hibiscus sabdariffa TaxID=183260 RepID=A0ABR2ETW3_9ROSI
MLASSSCRNRIHEVLDPAFTRLGINTSSASYNTIVREIIGRGLIIADMMVHRGYYCEVMYLQCSTGGKRDQSSVKGFSRIDIRI